MNIDIRIKDAKFDNRVSVDLIARAYIPGVDAGNVSIDVSGLPPGVTLGDLSGVAFLIGKRVLKRIEGESE